MANTVYNNKIIEAKAKDLLTTAVNTRNLMTIDDSLTQEAGMVKTINVYTYTGAAEALDAGQGNTNRGAITYEGKDYTVRTIQQVFDYQDEDFMKDNTIVDNMLKGANQVMVNAMNKEFIDELNNIELTHEVNNESGAFGYEAVVDAISLLNIEDESKLFVLIPNTWKADLRKDEDYKSARMGEVVYSGQVGTVCGIPVICTKALDENDIGYVMTTEAVKLFMKKDVEVEQERDANTRTNSVYLRANYVCAMVDATKGCRIVINK